MEFVSKDLIRLNKVLSDLDSFLIGFLKILSRYTNYVVVSGYVSILLGRARASEDIDVIIPKMDFSKFLLLLKELDKKGFYCLNAEYDKSIYDYINRSHAVRFAKQNTAIPNIELKFAKSKIDDISLKKTITVDLGKDKIIISNLETQIAFKEEVLKSPKDMEDARHLRNIAEKHLNKELIHKYKVMLHGF